MPTKNQRIKIIGTHCQSCKTLLEDVCADVPGIVSCQVQYQTGMADIAFTDDLDWSELKKAIEALGLYRVELPAKNDV